MSPVNWCFSTVWLTTFPPKLWKGKIQAPGAKCWVPPLLDSWLLFVVWRCWCSKSSGAAMGFLMVTKNTCNYTLPLSKLVCDCISELLNYISRAWHVYFILMAEVLNTVWKGHFKKDHRGRWFLGSLPTQTVLQFYDSVIHKSSVLCGQLQRDTGQCLIFIFIFLQPGNRT